ncbi:hypothetical protein [Enterobacter sp. 22466]|uniref:hypothetical protein n=1 Tax=Enterobacter sp. 22466 TaxID=3453924 RepID=UPI003F849DAB
MQISYSSGLSLFCYGVFRTVSKGLSSLVFLRRVKNSAVTIRHHDENKMSVPAGRACDKEPYNRFSTDDYYFRGKSNALEIVTMNDPPPIVIVSNDTGSNGDDEYVKEAKTALQMIINIWKAEDAFIVAQDTTNCRAALIGAYRQAIECFKLFGGGKVFSNNEINQIQVCFFNRVELLTNPVYDEFLINNNSFEKFISSYGFFRSRHDLTRKEDISCTGSEAGDITRKPCLKSCISKPKYYGRFRVMRHRIKRGDYGS